MKVLLVLLHGSFKGSGGSSISAKNLLTYLIKKKADVHVIVRNLGDFTDWMQANGITVHVVSTLTFFAYPSFTSLKDKFLYPLILLRNILFTSFSTMAVRKIIRDIRPDIVHSNNSVFVYGYNAAIKENVPHIWHLREYTGTLGGIVPITFMSALKQKLNKSYTISVSADIADHFECDNPNKDIVVFNAFDTYRKKEYSETKGNYFLFVGNLSEAKGVEDVIVSFCKFAQKHKHPDLWLVGDGKEEYKAYLNKIIQSYNVSNRIKFLGYRKDGVELMNKAQALIVSSHIESFGLVALEGMMSACLVIGNNVYGTKMLFNNCEGCELPYVGNEELIKRMEEVHKNGSDFYRERVLRAQEIAQELYSLENYGSNIYSFYKAILAGKYKI